MRFTIDAVDYDLEEGDSIHFRTAYPHSWANPSDRAGAGDLAGDPQLLTAGGAGCGSSSRSAATR